MDKALLSLTSYGGKHLLLFHKQDKNKLVLKKRCLHYSLVF